MKIKDLLRLLQYAPEKDKEIYIPSIENDRTTNIGFNFDNINNLELYEVSDNSNQNLEDIREIRKHYLKDKQIELDRVNDKIKELSNLYINDNITDAQIQLKILKLMVSEIE